MATMKEAVVREGPRSELITSPIPSPGRGEVLIKVHVAGTNPKDYSAQWVPNAPINMGDDIAGTIHTLGEGVSEFQAGDRVMAFHVYHAPGGAHAEYALAPASTTAKIGEKVSFEEAATIPLAAMTAALGLYRSLKLPQPWTPAVEKTPLLVYGGSSAVGAFAIKLAKASNIHPIISVAGRGVEYVNGLLDPSKGDVVLDYREGRAALEKGIKDGLAAAGVEELSYAFDAISVDGTYGLCAEMLKEGGKLTVMLPLPEAFKLPKGVTSEFTIAGHVHGLLGDKPGARDFGFVYMRGFSRGLEEGWFSGHPYEVMKGGLNGLQEALIGLKEGKNSAKKYIMRISETPEL